MNSEINRKYIRLGLGFLLLIMAVRCTLVYVDFFTSFVLIILAIAVLNNTDYDTQGR